MIEYWEDHSYIYQVDTLTKRFRHRHRTASSFHKWLDLGFALSQCRKLTRLECKLRGLS